DQLASQSAADIAAQAPHLVIDHIDPWFGDRAAETTLFHLYNIMKEEGRSLLLTMRMAPVHVNFALPDLASRLRAAPAAAIHAPDDTLLAAILVKLFADRQLNVGQDVIAYIVPRMERSFAAAVSLVDRADRLALAEKRNIAVPLMRQLLLQTAAQED
ncbi:MAG: DNA replication protein, partial [Alphaproteobacteria bacterium]|nr:DNA replication protein [Alphaproteobacteria bacterium]